MAVRPVNRIRFIAFLLMSLACVVWIGHEITIGQSGDQSEPIMNVP
jgi:hypothetical protein